MADEDEDALTLGTALATISEIKKKQEIDTDDEMVVVTDWKVKSDGRLTIPKDKREKYDIEEDDDVDAILLVRGD